MKKKNTFWPIFFKYIYYFKSLSDIGSAFDGFIKEITISPLFFYQAARWEPGTKVYVEL
jgi:hypothetical protein